MTRQSVRSDFLMLLIAFIWGSTFVAQRLGMDAVGPLFFSGSRFILGALLLLPLIFLRGSAHGRSPGLWRDGILLGAIIAIGINMQQIGLQYTSIANAGFITGLYVIIVPLLGLFLRHRLHAATWGGVLLAVAGMYFLSVQGDFTVSRGDALQLIGAFAWAAHLLLLSARAKRHDPICLSVVQFFVCGLLCLALSAAFEHTRPADVLAAKWAILYAGGFSVGIGYTLQVVAQRHAIASHAAIIFSMEAVFAALAAWLVLDERLSPRGLFGCALILAGMLIAQLVPLYLNKEAPAQPHPQ